MILPTLIPSTLAWADDVAVEPAAEPTRPANDKPAEKTVAPASNTVVAAACLPDSTPVYVEDWGRLAALTQSDPLIFPRAEFWAKRKEQTNWVLGTGLFLGGGAVTLGALNGLTTGEWSRPAKWQTAGVGVALVSYLAYLAFSPDRDDLLTIINQWNLRHRDRLLAP